MLTIWAKQSFWRVCFLRVPLLFRSFFPLSGFQFPSLLRNRPKIMCTFRIYQQNAKIFQIEFESRVRTLVASFSLAIVIYNIYLTCISWINLICLYTNQFIKPNSFFLGSCDNLISTVGWVHREPTVELSKVLHTANTTTLCWRQTVFGKS